MKVISTTVDEFNKREHVDEVREDLENQIEGVNEVIIKKRDEDVTEKKSMTAFA